MTNAKDFIEIILNIIEESINNKKYVKLDHDFFTGLFEMILDCMELVELFLQKEKGEQKKQTVIEIGETIVSRYYPDKLDFYHQHINNLIETCIQSFKILSKVKLNQSSCCLPFFQKKKKIKSNLSF